jgi:predicted branched-subunit amino acid permease
MAGNPTDSGDEPALPARHPRFTAHGVWRGAVEIAPLAAFVMPFGIAFGGAASAKAVPPAVALLMSGSMFAGASQFAALDLWRAPLPLAMLTLTVLAVNARHLLLGAALAPWLLRLPLARRLAALLLLSDPNFAQAMAAHDRGEPDAGILFGSGLAMWLVWLAGTAVGAYGGAFLGDPARFGFDAVMVSYFAAVVLGQWKGAGDLTPWLAAAAVALLCSWLLPPGWHIVAGALAGGAAGAWRHGR